MRKMLKNKGIIFAVALCLLFFLPLPLRASAEHIVLSPQKLTVDGKSIICEKYNIDNYNYFKLRDIAYVLNRTDSQFSVDWDSASQTVSIRSGSAYVPNGSELDVSGGDKSATAVASRQNILINHVLRTDLQVYNIGGNNFFKLRDLASALNFEVDYDALSNTAVINSPLKTLSAKEISKKCSEAVFYIENWGINGAPVATGSGFFISPSGLAITNYHVVTDGYNFVAMTTDGSKYTDIKILDVSQEHDLALLQISGGAASGSFPYLTLGDSDAIEQGDEIYAIGSPKGLDNTLSKGIISNVRRMVDSMEYIQISVPIDHGSSGGALINERGQVIGITTAGIINQTADLNLAVASNWISQLNMFSEDDYMWHSLDTYGNFDYLLDYGVFTGAQVTYQETTPIGYYYEYSLNDFYDAFSVSAARRKEIARAKYAEMLTRNGLVRRETGEPGYEVYANDDEYLAVYYDYDKGVIAIWAEWKLYRYALDVFVPSFGWYAGLEEETRTDGDGNPCYVIQWSGDYNRTQFERVLSGYIELLKYYEFVEEESLESGENVYVLSSDECIVTLRYSTEGTVSVTVEIKESSENDSESGIEESGGNSRFNSDFSGVQVKGGLRGF